MHEVRTPEGPARVHVDEAARRAGLLVLGHGAGGGVEARDLLSATRAAAGVGFTVARVEQPYRVAGRRGPPPPARLDPAWTAVVEQLRVGDLPLVVGGRSSGARVACRTAAATGATAVLCLAFPLHPPGRPEKSRLAELDAVGVPTLVVQGVADPFGMPPERPGRKVVRVQGGHALRDAAAVAEATREWLEALLADGA